MKDSTKLVPNYGKNSTTAPLILNARGAWRIMHLCILSGREKMRAWMRSIRWLIRIEGSKKSSIEKKGKRKHERLRFTDLKICCKEKQGRLKWQKRR